MLDVITRSLNALLMIALPLGLGAVLARKLGAAWETFGIGALTFVASQVFHIPFNAWVLSPIAEKWGLADPQSAVQLASMAILLGVDLSLLSTDAGHA